MSDKLELCLMLNTKTETLLGDRFGKIKITVVTRNSDKQIRNFMWDWQRDKPYTDYQDLEIFAQMSDDYAADRSQSYGWSVGYRSVFSVDLQEATRMFKTLKRIESKLAKLREFEGSPESFGQYVLRVCKVLKINTLLTTETDYSRFDDNQYREYRGGDLVSKINSTVWQINKDLLPDDKIGA